MQGDSLESVENDTFKSDDTAREPGTPREDLSVPDLEVCLTNCTTYIINAI